MPKRRLFIAINLPDKIKESLREFRDAWRDFPCRWTKIENIHLTLYFIGEVGEDKIPEVIKAVENAISGSQPFELTITDTVYGPSKQKPRMIWARIERARELIELQQKISRNLNPRETRPFSPHLTLCRFNAFDLKRWSGEELPDIRTEVNKSFKVKSVELMESRPARGGSVYSVVQSLKL